MKKNSRKAVFLCKKVQEMYCKEEKIFRIMKVTRREEEK